MDKLISVIIPVHDEEENISLIYRSLMEVWQDLKENYDYEILFVNDGSNDNSGEMIERLATSDKKIKYIELSRNFGKEIATSAGLHRCKGDAAIMIDADLQHPVEVIPEFIRKWQDGAEIVIGIREHNQAQGLIRRVGSFLFYKIINLIGETEIISHATDYRLIDRAVIREFNRFTEHVRITRGLLDWLGFKRDFLYFTAQERTHSSVSYTYQKLLKLAMAAMITHSLFPLKLAGYLGLIITSLSAVLGLFIFIEKYILDDPWNLKFSGPAMLAVIILLLVGVILICLGLTASYIASIHREVLNRPLYVIRRAQNLD